MIYNIQAAWRGCTFMYAAFLSHSPAAAHWAQLEWASMHRPGSWLSSGALGFASHSSLKGLVWIHLSTSSSMWVCLARLGSYVCRHVCDLQDEPGSEHRHGDRACPPRCPRQHCKMSEMAVLTQLQSTEQL